MAKNNIVAAWMTFFRGISAVTLGIALLVRPDVARPFLNNFIGAFWLSGGLLSIRWGLQTKQSRVITIVVGVIGIMAGTAVLGRNVAARWIDSDLIVTMLGIVALLTGLLHVSGRMTVRHAPVGDLSRTGLLLGIMEIVLGLVLLFGSTSSNAAYTVSVVWALLGGFALFNDARLMREEALSTLVDERKESVI